VSGRNTARGRAGIAHGCGSGRRRFALLVALASGCAPAARERGGAELSGPGPESRVIESRGSVCVFERPGSLARRADGALDVPPSHPLLAYTGRLDCQAPGGPMLAFPGSSVQVRFVGTGLELRLRDFGTGTPQTTNYFDVTVDGGAPRLLQVSPAQEQYVLAAELAPGEHELSLFKRVEASPGGQSGAGRAQLLGFVLHGRALLPVALPERKLEFVGDSITCGYGDELETMSPESAHYTTLGSNAHKAYGAVTASLLGARYAAVAYSGRGVSRNYAGGPGALLPELYLSSVPEQPAADWDPTRYVPDAVIVNLGTNDFSTPGIDRAQFVARYAAFLERLRGYYPRAALVVALGPMLSDSYPPGAQAWSNAQADVQKAVALRAQAGDRNVHVVLFAPHSGPWGEDWHPSAATHAKMAEQLAASLKRILGW
jgi:lysophospholipase L1-like esterase